MSETAEMKTCELEGAALDWAVAMAEGEEVIVHGIGQYRYDVRGGIHCCKYGCTFGPRSMTKEVERYEPSDSWAQGGPLITKYLIEFAVEHARTICACLCDENGMYISGCSYGDTYLIAACRAIVTAKLGETVNVPAELIK
ncbi:TPA: phage protein NinX family protein [Pseudomonas aeruginosa]|uniref:phage protein NinX family protein n=1 Tax=Pseudomonas aeruginosa TaxID=287 RepID=UPI003B24E51E